MISRLPSTNPTPITSSRCVCGFKVRLKKWRHDGGKRVVGVRASVERSGGDVGERKIGGDGGDYRSSGMEVITFNDKSFSDTELPAWDNIGAVVRLTYGIGSCLFS